ncbi:hypothetical protein Taro_017800 [Colocasia esculenta]|uniref:Uncharacterized protein n=1 Tax=Colocasia esculenta TaxID=4460 RepID=A0A843UH41_COLES|nr:hypothetical protein [Colocasia esculenta]
MAYVAFPSRLPRCSLTDVTGVLCVSTALAVSGWYVAFTGSGLKARAPEPFPLSRVFPFPLSPSHPLGVPAFLGCLPRVEAAVLRRLSLRSCRGRTRVTALPGPPDPWAAIAKIGSSAWAEGRVLGSLQLVSELGLTGLVVDLNCNSESSQQWQGARRAEETGR